MTKYKANESSRTEKMLNKFMFPLPSLKNVINPFESPANLAVISGN
jgi:hypothetical protein